MQSKTIETELVVGILNAYPEATATVLRLNGSGTKCQVRPIWMDGFSETPGKILDLAEGAPIKLDYRIDAVEVISATGTGRLILEGYNAYS